MPLKKVIVEQSELMNKFPAAIGSEFDGLIKRLRLRDIDTIDLGKISPPVPGTVSEILKSQGGARAVGRRGGRSIEAELKRKIADWLKSRFDVSADPEREITLTTGNTPAVYFTLQCLLNRGDGIFIPDPSYSMYRSAATAAGAEVLTYELSSRTDFLPNLDLIGDAGGKGNRAIIVNYPHNPTTSVADESFYSKLTHFARKNNILVISDAVYNTHVWDRWTHPALVSAVGALYAAIEFFTFSFIFNLPMLKLGFAVGCKDFIRPLEKIMSAFNSRPSGFDLQIGSLLMDHCDEIISDVSQSLGSNREVFTSGVRPLGWELHPSHASPFIWIRLPRRRQALNFCRMLLKRTGVVTLPGSSFGEKGEGYMRVSIAADRKDIEQAVDRINAHAKIYQRRYRQKQGPGDE